MFIFLASLIISSVICAHLNEGLAHSSAPIKSLDDDNQAFLSYRVPRSCPPGICGFKQLVPPCSSHGCVKRGNSLGPFWANRGKKDPTYRQEPLYVEEPHWILVHRAREDAPFKFDNDAFFVTRGKKNSLDLIDNPEDYLHEEELGLRFRRDYDPPTPPDDSPFFAARGKKQLPIFEDTQNPQRSYLPS